MVQLQAGEEWEGGGAVAGGGSVRWGGWVWVAHWGKDGSEGPGDPAGQERSLSFCSNDSAAVAYMLATRLGAGRAAGCRASGW
eukprot:307331-Chlamydomonas_euryale.AAC.1